MHSVFQSNFVQLTTCQIRQRIDLRTIFDDFKMQMGACGVACTANQGDWLALCHLLARRYQNLAGVGIHGLIPVSVVNQQMISISIIMQLYIRNRSAVSCHNRLPIGISVRKIKSPVGGSPTCAIVRRNIADNRRRPSELAAGLSGNLSGRTLFRSNHNHFVHRLLCDLTGNLLP